MYDKHMCPRARVHKTKSRNAISCTADDEYDKDDEEKKTLRSVLISLSYEEFHITENCFYNIKGRCAGTIKDCTNRLIKKIILRIIALMSWTIIKEDYNL